MRASFFYALAVGCNLFWILIGHSLPLNTQMMVPICTLLSVSIGLGIQYPRLPRVQWFSHLRMALFFCFLYYLAILSILLFFGGLFHVQRDYGGGVNLVPFHTIESYWKHYLYTKSQVSLRNLLGNFLLMIPLGIFLPLLSPAFQRAWVTLPLLALAALSVEWIQWTTKTGIADIDDSILNMIGAMLGYGVVRTLQLLFIRWKSWRAARRN